MGRDTACCCCCCCCVLGVERPSRLPESGRVGRMYAGARESVSPFRVPTSPRHNRVLRFKVRAKGKLSQRPRARVLVR